MAELMRLVVIAPVPKIDYSNGGNGLFRYEQLPKQSTDGAVPVIYARWLYPPGGGVSNAFCMFASLLPLVRQLWRSRQFDVIDCHHAFPEGMAGFLLAKSLGCPFTITLRGNELSYKNQLQHRKAMSYVFQRASKLIAVSRELQRLAIDLGAEPERVHVIPNGICVDTFYPRNRQVSRREFGIPPGRKAVVSAGTLSEHKGHHDIVRTLPELIRQGLDVQLLVAGRNGRSEKPFDQMILTAARKIGVQDRVTLVGWLRPGQLASLMSAADVFCLASRSEGWPNVVHEALACGAPVVATGVGAVPDMLPRESLGFVVPSSETGILATALARALRAEWDRASISKWGRMRSWRHVAQEVFDVLGPLPVRP